LGDGPLVAVDQRKEYESYGNQRETDPRASATPPAGL
jgi:hypothetical protein